MTPYPSERAWDYLTSYLLIRFPASRRHTSGNHVELVRSLLPYLEAGPRAAFEVALGEIGVHGTHHIPRLASVLDPSDNLQAGLQQILAGGRPSYALFDIGRAVPWETLFDLVTDLYDEELSSEAKEEAKPFLLYEDLCHRAGQVVLAVQWASKHAPVTEAYLRYVKEQDHSDSERLAVTHAIAVEAGLTPEQEEVYYQLLLDGAEANLAAASAQLLVTAAPPAQSGYPSGA